MAASPEEVNVSLEYLRAIAPIVAAVIAMIGVALTLLVSRLQFKKTEKRISEHFQKQAQSAAEADATKEKPSARQFEILRIKAEVIRAANAVAKLVKVAIVEGDNSSIVRSTTIAFQDVAPLSILWAR